jgi:AbrB family looped-hinge helix DNA binding protein
MSAVTISSDFSIQLPLEVRTHLNLQPGQEIDIVTYNGRIAMIPLRPIEEMRGFLKGMESDVKRDDGERV